VYYYCLGDEEITGPVDEDLVCDKDEKYAVDIA
jgi:hypothetical protein